MRVAIRHIDQSPPLFYAAHFPGTFAARDTSVFNRNYRDSQGNWLQVASATDCPRDETHKDVLYILEYFGYEGPGDWIEFNPNLTN